MNDMNDTCGVAWSCQRHPGKVREQRATPGGRAHGARRRIAIRSRARIAEPHGQNRNRLRVVERLAAEAHPLPQPDTARIVEGDSGLMGTTPGRLRGNEDLGGGVNLEHRPRTMRQRDGADPAGSHLPHERDK